MVVDENRYVVERWKWKKMWWGRGSLSRSVASEERIAKSPGKRRGFATSPYWG